jgi:hypothetical protein
MTEKPTTTHSLPKILSLIVGVIGVLMVAVGITVFAYSSHQLGNEQITVAAVTADDPGSLAGKPVAGPFTALAQINAIDHHMRAATGGKTYAQLGNVASTDGQTYSKDVTVAASTDGQAHQAGDPLSAQDAATYAARSTAQQASFLQASLFVSVLAFGVSTLIIGLGVVVVLIALTLWASLRSPRPAPAVAHD